VFIFICLTWNLGNIGLEQFSTPKTLNWIALTFHLDQHFEIFSPDPPTNQWSLFVIANFNDNTSAEVFQNGGFYSMNENPILNYDHSNPFETMRSHRWYKYFEYLVLHPTKKESIRAEFSKWYCKTWNQSPYKSKIIRDFNVFLLIESTNLDNSRTFQSPIQQIWNQTC